MSEIIKTIKDLSHKVSEGYLLFNEDMNDSLIELIESGSIENIEVLKRICEQANQNVYLALFHDTDVDNSNITFDIADFDEVSLNIKKSEEAMKDYNTPPKDYRSKLEVAIEPSPARKSENEKLGELNEVIEYKNSLNNFLNRIGIMKSAEIKSAEESLNKMARDAKTIVGNGDSLGDIAKLAARHVKENIGGDAMKIAECYEIIRKDLVDSNFNVKTGFTKISSYTINKNSMILKPVEEFSLSTTKIAGFAEMEENLKKVIETFDKTIKENRA